MSLASLIKEFKTKIFGEDKPKIAKIAPKMDNEYIPDLEAGEGGFYRRLKQRQQELELYSKPKDWDLEKSCSSTMSEEVIMDINGYEKCKIIENYIAFIDIINYFAAPIAEREIMDLPFANDDTLHPTKHRLSSSHIAIDVIKDDLIDTPLNLCVSNIL